MSSDFEGYRTTNLKLAAGKIDGTVLLPGEVFSYNNVVGERTISAGYKDAAIYLNGQVVDGLGGGICQISTTLFNAVLFSNLEIVELYNHQFVPSYATAGRDATVVYGLTDFKFKNTRTYAIKIKAGVSNGIATISIYGIKEENEYTTALYDFFANNMKLGESDAWDTVGDCILEIKNGENPLEEVLSYLDYRKLLPEEKNLSELIGVISRLNNFTRTPVNRGFTPVELNQLGGGLSADSIVFEEDDLIPQAVFNSNS